MFTPGQAVKLSLILWLSILPSVAAQLRAQHQHPSFNLNDSYNNNSTSNNDKTKRYLKKPKRIVIVSDIGIKLSGVHTCLTNTVRVLEDMGYDVMYLNPVSLNLWTFPLYGIDRHFLAPIVLPWEAEEISQMVTEFKPDHIHIHTPRGPLTAILLDLCNKNAWKFSTAFTTVRVCVRIDCLSRVRLYNPNLCTLLIIYRTWLGTSIKRYLCLNR